MQQRWVPEATPRFEALPYEEGIRNPPRMGFPCFIKPVKAGVYRGTAQLVQNGVTSSVLTLAQAALSLDVSAGALDISNSVVGGQGVF